MLWCGLNIAEQYEIIFDDRLDRENNCLRMPSANGFEWMNFILHHLLFFDETIYTHIKARYTHLDFDQYINTQKKIIL